MRALVAILAWACISPIAVAFAQQPLSKSADADTAGYYFLLGRRLEGAGRVEEAIAAHKRAIDLEPGSAELRAELAGLYARQDRAIESLEMAEAALQRDPDNQEANRILGSVYAALAQQKQPLRKGDDPATYPLRAIAALEKVRRDGGVDLGVDMTLGRLYLLTGAYPKAIPVLQRVVDEQPAAMDSVFMLVTAFERTEQPDRAIATLEAALDANPNSFRAQLRLAEVFEGQERWNEAADAFGKAQALNPRATVLTTRRAVALISAGRAREARDLVKPAIDARVGAPDPVLLYLLAESQRQLKELDAAHATVQKLLAARPDDARANHVLSLILQDRGDVKGSERVLRDLIARNPQDGNALNSLGYMLAERGERLAEAIDLVQRALKVEPGNPSYLDSLGWAYFQQGRIDLADGPLTEAAAKLKDSSVVQDHLGDLRLKQGRLPDAVAAWERALKGDGQSVDRSKIDRKIREARGRM